jgi:hypothetical protein
LLPVLGRLLGNQTPGPQVSNDQAARSGNETKARNHHDLPQESDQQKSRTK